MGGVDIANQLRAIYETHRKAWRSWWPLFYWCLDTALVNAYRISYILRTKCQLPQLTHAEFREALYKTLFMQGRDEHKHQCELQPQPKEQHNLIEQEKWQYCYWCQLQVKIRVKKGLTDKRLRPKQTQSVCQACHVPLCRPGLRDCWKAFHSQRTPLNERSVNNC
jgi:hypothetical protein